MTRFDSALALTVNCGGGSSRTITLKGAEVNERKHDEREREREIEREIER